MNIIHRILRTVTRPLVLGVLAAAALGSTLQAATIELCVYARGQLALIVPGSNLGGRVVYSPQYGRYITDRAARGECVVATAYPNGEWTAQVFESQLRSTGGTKNLGMTSLWQPVYFLVPTSPYWDDNHVWVRTVCGWFKKHLPVGSR